MWIKDEETQAKNAFYQQNFVGAARCYKKAADVMRDLGGYGLERSPGDQIMPAGITEFDPEAETYGERTAFVYTEKATQLYQHALTSLQTAMHHGETEVDLYAEGSYVFWKN